MNLGWWDAPSSVTKSMAIRMGLWTEGDWAVPLHPFSSFPFLFCALSLLPGHGHLICWQSTRLSWSTFCWTGRKAAQKSYVLVQARVARLEKVVAPLSQLRMHVQYACCRIVQVLDAWCIFSASGQPICISCEFRTSLLVPLP